MELTNIREIFRNKDKFADKELLSEDGSEAIVIQRILDLSW